MVVRTKVSFGHSTGSSGPAPVAAKGLGPKSTTIESFEAFEDLWAFSVWSHCDSLDGMEGNKVNPGEIIKWPVWCQGLSPGWYSKMAQRMYNKVTYVLPGIKLRLTSCQARDLPAVLWLVLPFSLLLSSSLLLSPLLASPFSPTFPVPQGEIWT